MKLALVAIASAAFVALPLMSSIRASGEAKALGAFLFTVTTTDDHNDFSCDSADCTLREAIQAANNNAGADGIDFSVTGTITLASVLPDIADDLEINAPGADMLIVTRILQPPNFRIFNVTTAGTVALSGLSIIGGEATSGTNGIGGGIQNSGGGTLNVTNCTLTSNLASAAGGGIANTSTGINGAAGTVNVTNCTMTRNRTGFGFGGAIFTDVFGTVSVTNCTISESFAYLGGGIFSQFSTVNVVNSMLTRNEAFSSGGGIWSTGTLGVTNSTLGFNRAISGGGIFCSGGTLDVADSTFESNSAGVGGGVFNHSSTLSLTNTTLSGNSATAFNGFGVGGGILNEGTSVSICNLSNSTVTGNSSDNGGGIAQQPPDPSTGDIPGTFNVKSSIVALNTAGSGRARDAFGDFISQGFNLIGNNDMSTGFAQATDLVGTVNAPLAPMLDPNGLQNNGGPTKTIALLCGSPAIDKGTSNSLTGTLATDQRGKGFPRTLDDNLFPNAEGGDGTDIGAFELSTQDCNHPPVAQCKNIQVSAGSDCQASITPSQVDNGSFDPDPGDSIATRTLDNSGPFGLGPHTVMLTVTDTHGASSSCSSTVTVVDTTPPTLTCPPNSSVPAAQGQCQAVVTYATPAVSDNCPGAMLLGCAPASGSIFQVGTTPVTCTAKDAAGNNGSCQFQVIVFDNQPPTITCPANITALTDQSACPNPACKVVGFPPPVASDNCTGVTVVCNPPAGSCFPTGVTTVTCTASDTAGNTATCSFTVTVFDTALQDDSNPSIILLWNSITGEYRFCCNGTTFTGFGVSIVKGCTYTLQHNPADRRVLGKVDKSVHAGSGSLQSPPGQIRCTITDRSTLNDTNLTSCQ